MDLFFFNLENKSAKENQMHSLKNSNGHCTSDPGERLAVDFYCNLYSTENIDIKTQNEFLKDLPCLNEDESKALDFGLTYGELSEAVAGLSTGRTPGIDGLPSEFYKHLW